MIEFDSFVVSGLVVLFFTQNENVLLEAGRWTAGLCKKPKTLIICTDVLNLFIQLVS